VATTIIVNPDTLEELPTDRIGEIWVSGPSVTAGYWNRPAETELTFRAHPTRVGSGDFLRTGDLGFLTDGELFVTGRLKDLIIIGGHNHYPQDIERTVAESHPVLDSADCAAFSVDLDGEEELVVVAAISARQVDLVGEVQRAIRTAVAERHDLRIRDVVLITTSRLPRTASGKIRRHACRSRYLSQTLDTAECP
jgi:acyl-CoA synthetase (AMP-forming)/AMP-acid ligase II